MNQNSDQFIFLFFLFIRLVLYICLLNQYAKVPEFLRVHLMNIIPLGHRKGVVNSSEADAESHILHPPQMYNQISSILHTIINVAAQRVCYF